MRFILALMIMVTLPLQAAIYSAPPSDSRMIGYPLEHRVTKGQSLDHIAQDYNMGLLALMAANPGVDPFLPPTDSKVLLPAQMLLPDAPRQGVVVNLAELRLYYFDQPNNRVYVYPIGIGRIGRETPVGKTKISQKIKNPTWTPTANIRKEWLEEKDIELPPVVQAGPDNPLGHRALRLGMGNGEYLIHGTNKEFGIGMRVSAGCIRLRPNDIEELFGLVKRGDPVRIVNDPVKISQENDGLYMEVHEPLSTQKGMTKSDKQVDITDSQHSILSKDGVDQLQVTSLLLEQQGLPVRVN